MMALFPNLNACPLLWHMAQSLSNGYCWFRLAATSIFSFDAIFAQFINHTYYGEVTSIEDRSQCSTSKSTRTRGQARTAGVRLKMQQQAEGRELDEYLTLDQQLIA